MKLAKTQVKAKQHLAAELLLLENYSLSSTTLSSKNNRRYKKQVLLFKRGYMTNDNENEAQNES